MSDDEKKNGNAKIASLVNRAKGRFNKQEPDEPQESRDDSLELDVEDPTRPQETPPTLTAGRDDLELDAEEADGGKKENFLGRMTMMQRAILVAVVVGAVFIGHRTINDAGADMGYLGQDEPTQTQPGSTQREQEAAANQESATTPSDGFEPIAQGNIAPDNNAIDLTPGSSVNDADNAFSLDPIEPELTSADASAGKADADKSSLEGTNPEVTGAPDFGSANDDSSRGGNFDGAVSGSDLGEDDVMVSNQPLGQMTLDGEFIPAPSRRGGDFGSRSSAPSVAPTEIKDIKAKLQSLNSVVSSLSQSVVSIENEVSNSTQDDAALRKEIRTLMSELKVRDQKVRSLTDRPELSDLVIFRAAANCSSCVPHALFSWDGDEVEVGDGLQWQGFDVAIRGDRLSLIKGADEYHYWYR